MREFKQDLKTTGYSQEEAYFYKLNRRLITKLKERFGRKSRDEPKDPDEVGLEHIEYEEKKAA